MIERAAILRKLRVVQLGHLALVFRLDFDGKSMRDASLFPSSMEGALRTIFLHFGVTDLEHLEGVPVITYSDGLGNVKGIRSYAELEPLMFEQLSHWLTPATKEPR